MPGYPGETFIDLSKPDPCSELPDAALCSIVFDVFGDKDTQQIFAVIEVTRKGVREIFGLESSVGLSVSCRRLTWR